MGVADAVTLPQRVLLFREDAISYDEARDV